MPRLRDKTYREPHVEDVVGELQHDDTFRIGRMGSSYAVKTLACKSCAGVSFMVGQDDYFVALSCRNCGYEVPLHYG